MTDNSSSQFDINNSSEYYHKDNPKFIFRLTPGGQQNEYGGYGQLYIPELARWVPTDKEGYAISGKDLKEYLDELDRELANFLLEEEKEKQRRRRCKTSLDKKSISRTFKYSEDTSGKEKSEKIANNINIKTPGKKGGTKWNIHKRFPKSKWYDIAFQEWALEYMKCKFVSLGVDEWGDMSIKTGDIGLRWSEKRQKKNRAIVSLWSEQEMVLARRDYYMVSLTVQHGTNNSYSDMVNTVAMLRACWGNVARYINRKGWKYLRVMEPGEINHYPHYHLVLCNVDNEWEVDELVSIWLKSAHKHNNNASRSAQDIRHTENVQKVGAYVAKYLSKTMEYSITDPYWWRWMELCYRNGIRTFAMDSDSRKYVKTKQEEYITGVYGGVLITSEDVEEEPIHEPSEQETS